MAEDTIRIKLESNLNEVANATKGLNLTKSQQDSANKYVSGAKFALNNQDFKLFQQNFNRLVDLFKNAAASSGTLSKTIEQLTSKQIQLNKEINTLKDKKTNLETKFTSNTKKFSADAAKEFASTNSTAKKVLLSDGIQATRNQIIELQKALVEYLEKTGKNLRQITNADVQNIKTASGLQFQNRNAAQAANSYVAQENAYAVGLQKDLTATSEELTAKETEANALAEKINQLDTASTNAASGLDELYKKIVDIANATNSTVTETRNQERRSQVNNTPATTSTSIPDSNKFSQGSTPTLGKAFKQFSIYAIALRSIKKAAHEAVSTIKELDRSLTEQAMVTGKTRKQTYALLSSYQELAAQTGATTREVAGLATQFMRQGKTTQDALTLTKAAMDAAKVAGISATDSINYLTTALNGFQLSANDAMSVSDKFAAIAANAATSYDEIATALSKVASQANLAGMSIDYTTALLAKGLETTREAPETMGTALKTVIARMREISDYGETLGGDTDINNVESQLAYVGIALRDANGELRSTEEVLDELGKKWTELNSNQQAAVAKALAGTRQQSRLIAMMTDYERVIELQQISERSAGATLAQMETYLEGMDAALNKVNVAWESIVTNLVDNEFIISLVDGFSSVLNIIGRIFSTTSTLAPVMALMVMYATSLGAKKLEEYKIAKLQQKIDKEKRINELKTFIEARKQTLEKEKQIKLDIINQKVKKDELTEAEAKAEIAEINAQYTKDIIDNDEQILIAQGQINLLQNESVNQTAEVASNIGITGGGILSAITGSNIWLGIMTALGFAIKILPPLIKRVNAEMHKSTQEGFKGALAAMAKTAADSLGVPGLIMAATLLAMAGIAGVANLISTSTNKASKTADEVNSLSNEIYKLETKARALENVTSSYAELDNQIIKTQKDQEKMNELLDQAADKLDEEEQKAYKALATNEQRIRYLEAIQSKAEQDANKKRQEQLNKINKLSPTQRANFLDPNSTDSDVLTAQSAIYAINNAKLYDFVDGLEDAQEGVEKLAQSLLSQLSPAEALAFANTPDKIKDLVKTLNNAEVQLSNGNNAGVASVLTSDDYSVVDKVKAYREALDSLDDSMKETFKTVYSDIEAFSNFSSSVLEFIDNSGVSIDNLNAIGKAIQKLGYNSEESADELQYLFGLIADGTDIQDAIYTTFGDISDEDYKKFINAYQSAMGTGVLNMGQNIEGLKKTINSFYEKAQEWNEMSDSEKTSFLADNAALFEGPDGQKLLEAIKSGDYNFIQNALGDNKTLKDKVAQQIKDIDTEIAIENAKLEADRDYAYIAYLEEQKKLLQDSDNLYAASLDVRLEQEKKYLDEYKSYLEDQRDALKESLDKRKEAYSDYFESINQQADDEDFEEKESTLIANISKLATSGSADAVNQQAKLEQELAQLEKERLEELRQRAQDAVMENIDKTIEDIDQKFDELLNSQQALLNAMNGDLDNPGQFLSNMIGNKIITEGLTDLQLTDYIKELQATYGSLNQFAGVDWNSLGQVLNTLNLNVNGTTINNLTAEEQQSVYTAIMTALQQVGLR